MPLSLSQRFATALRPHTLLVLRLILGVVFVHHGGWKFTNFALTVDLFTQWGLPLPVVSTLVVGVLEVLGGIALILGLGVFYVALPLAWIMLVAIVVVHLPAGFSGPNGYEFPLTVFVAVLAQGVSGPGALALETFVARRRELVVPDHVQQAA